MPILGSRRCSGTMAWPMSFGVSKEPPTENTCMTRSAEMSVILKRILVPHTGFNSLRTTAVERRAPSTWFRVRVTVQGVGDATEWSIMHTHSHLDYAVRVRVADGTRVLIRGRREPAALLYFD